MTIHQPISGMPTCVRKAWLALGGNTLQLEDPTAGYFCQSLDLGTPVMRTVMTNAPDQDGVIDRTQYMGARTVTAAITVLAGAGAQIDAVADNFAPYMVPSARPVLHYVLDRPGAPERTLTLRPDSYDWPIVGAAQRDVALQWIAPNPIALDATQQSVTVLWGGPFAVVNNLGDVPLRPLLQLTGPTTQGGVVFQQYSAPGVSVGNGLIAFLPTYTIAAGHTVWVDTAAHTVLLDNTTPILNQIDWVNTVWPVAPPNPGLYRVAWPGGYNTGTTAATQFTVLWNNGYLT
jgi:hypothetical protein